MSRPRFTFADGEPIGPLERDDGVGLGWLLLAAAMLVLACMGLA